MTPVETVPAKQTRAGAPSPRRIGPSAIVIILLASIIAVGAAWWIFASRSPAMTPPYQAVRNHLKLHLKFRGNGVRGRVDAVRDTRYGYVWSAAYLTRQRSRVSGQRRGRPGDIVVESFAPHRARQG